MTDDLMIRLARILQAETIDLRELARIAGADPASFYVGTSLEGVDIRGQDLRGMKLPGLDLEKARKDDETRIDEPELEFEIEDADALVYADFFGVRGPIQHSSGHGLMVFGAEDRQAFVEAARRFGGRILLLAPVTDLTGLFRVAEALDRLDLSYFCLAVEDYRDRYRRYWQMPMHGLLSNVVVVSGSVRLGRISGDAGGLVALLLLNWSEALQAIPQPVSIFVQKAGSGWNARDDAAARILEEAVVRGFGVGDNCVFLPQDHRHDDLDYRHDSPDGTPGWRLLLEPVRVVRINASKRYDLAVFISPRRGRNDLEAYAEAVGRALAGRGWRGVDVGVGRSVQLNLMLAYQELRLEVLPPRKSAAARGLPKLHESFARFYIPQADKVCLMPEAGLGRVTQLLVNEGLLLLSARDLLAAPPNPDTIWPFVGGQLMRVMEGGRLADQTPYIRLLLATALRANAVVHSAQDLLIDIVEGRTPPSFRFRVGGFREEDGGVVRAEMVIFDRPSHGPDQFVIQAHILVDRDGVSVGEEPPIRAEYRPGPFSDRGPALA